MDGTGGTGAGALGYLLSPMFVCCHFLPSLFLFEHGVAPAHVGAFEFEVAGRSGEPAEGAVGDELAAETHVPLLGFALAGDERGADGAACLHDLENEDAVRRVDRGGRESSRTGRSTVLNSSTFPVVGGLAVEPGTVDPRACPACACNVWGFPVGMRRCRGPG